MTESNSNVTNEQVKFIMDNLTYTLTTEEYRQLEKFPVLYDSLMNLLSALSLSDSAQSELSNVVSILDYFNESFFEFVKSLEANPIKELN